MPVKTLCFKTYAIMLLILPEIVLPVSLLGRNQELVNTYVLGCMSSDYWHYRKLLFRFKSLAIHYSRFIIR